MLLLNATDDTTRPIHLPPPPMTDPRLIALSSNPGQVEPGPFSEHDLREQWNAQADEFNQWESLDSAEQLAWAQTRAIAAAATASPELPKPEAERVLRLAEIINKVGLDYDSKDIVFSAAALAEAILAHPGFSGCHDGPAASAVSPVEPSPVVISEAQNMWVDELYTEWYRCPQCKDDMITRASNFCPKCGVKLQWE
jgi:predicted RNA-binding Zn-ribbon protein involved in translation (DUF1610 family)